MAASTPANDAKQTTASFLVQRLKPNAKVPTRGSSHAAGYDLYSWVAASLTSVHCGAGDLARAVLQSCPTVFQCNATLGDRRVLRRDASFPFPPDSAEDKVVPARGKALISTGLCIAVPEGTYGRVAPRSGLGEAMPHLHQVLPSPSWHS